MWPAVNRSHDFLLPLFIPRTVTQKSLVQPEWLQSSRGLKRSRGRARGEQGGPGAGEHVRDSSGQRRQLFDLHPGFFRLRHELSLSLQTERNLRLFDGERSDWTRRLTSYGQRSDLGGGLGGLNITVLLLLLFLASERSSSTAERIVPLVVVAERIRVGLGCDNCEDGCVNEDVINLHLPAVKKEDAFCDTKTVLFIVLLFPVSVSSSR